MNFGTQAKSILGAIAPIIGGALGGPFGAAAGLVLQKALGTNDPKALEASITSGDPDILVKLKQADNDFKVQMANVGVEEDKLRYDDAASARTRQEVVKDSTPTVLAYGVIIVTLAINALLFIYGSPKGLPDIALGRILGTWDAATMLVLSYYFGSSSGSADKSNTIAQLAGAK